MTVAELRELCPAFDWDVYVTNLSASAHEADELLVETCVRQPSYFEHLSTVLDEVSIEDWRTWLLTRVLRSVGAVPHRRLRRGQLRLLRPHPQRHAGAAGPLEARRRAWSRARSARRSARSTSPGTSRRRPRQQMDDLVANLLAAYRHVDRPARLDDRGDQAAGLREARHVPAQDRLPREVPRLLRAADPPRRPARATSRPRRRSRPTASSARSAPRSTATSGSCCRRPSTPTTTPAPTRSASRPGSCRSRSSAPTPSRPRTTAASARSSATRSATASTTRARSTTAPATSTTGGPPTTSRRSR